MRIIIAHNRYRQPGGEDAVVNTELALLKKYGHEVYFYERSNQEIDDVSWFKKLTLVSWRFNKRAIFFLWVSIKRAATKIEKINKVWFWFFKTTFKKKGKLKPAIIDDKDT